MVVELNTLNASYPRISANGVILNDTNINDTIPRKIVFGVRGQNFVGWVAWVVPPQELGVIEAHTKLVATFHNIWINSSSWNFVQ